MPPKNPLKKNSKTLPTKKTVKSPKKRIPKGFKSISFDTAVFMLIEAMGASYINARLSHLPDEDFLKFIENVSDEWMKETTSVFEEIVSDAVLRVSLAPIFKEIHKSKRINKPYIWTYLYSRLVFQVSGKLEKEYPTPLENDEILDLAFQQALGVDERFREYTIQKFAQGEEQFGRWYWEQRQECISEFRRLRSKLETAVKHYIKTLSKIREEQFDK